MNKLLRDVVLSYKPKDLTFQDYLQIRRTNTLSADFKLHYNPDYDLIKDFTWKCYMTKDWDLRYDIPGSYVSCIQHESMSLYYRLSESNLLFNEPDIWWFNYFCSEDLTIAMSEELIKHYDKILESNKFEMYRFINIVRRYRGKLWAENPKHSNIIYDINASFTKSSMKNCIEMMMTHFPDVVREKKLQKLLF